MVDMDAAIGFVVARGDPVERARLSWLRTAAVPNPEVLAQAELGQAAEGGWPAVWGKAPSVDATCFHLAELDDLGALARPSARKALDWLAARQAPDGTWEEDQSLAAEAPPWARPGDPEARLFLTASAAFWLTVAEVDAEARTRFASSLVSYSGGPAGGPTGPAPVGPAPTEAALAVGGLPTGGPPEGGAADGGEGQAWTANGSDAAPAPGRYAEAVTRAAAVIAGSLNDDGTWPSFLVTGWLGAAVLYRQAMYYESARMQMVLGDRVSGMSAADAAWLASTMRRVGVAEDDWLLKTARRRLTETQRSDGGWPSDDGPAFDVHTTLTAIRACRQLPAG